MPTIIKPTPWRIGRNADEEVTYSQTLLQATTIAWKENLLAAPGAGHNPQDSLPDSCLIRAFQQNLHLVLRPDDVWLAIITQFSKYVNRVDVSFFNGSVAHEAKREINVNVVSTPTKNMYLDFASQIMKCENIIDEELRDCIMPNFTTTTHNDKMVAAMVMMGTTKKGSKYSMSARGACGFPSVELLGDFKDWDRILQRVEKLSKYGIEPDMWRKMLAPIIRRMMKSFLLPDSDDVKNFWLRACYSNGIDERRSSAKISGWITAFCLWSETGQCLDPSQGRKDDIATAYSQDNDEGMTNRDEEHNELYENCVPLALDGVKYHILDFGESSATASSIPNGVVCLPFSMSEEITGLKFHTLIVVGSIGMSATTLKGYQTIVQPKSGWWMLDDSTGKL